MRFKATDGVPLKGTLTPVAGRRSPGIVLVHQSDGGPDQWDAFVPVLHRAGYATLAYGSRGTDTLDETVLTRDVAGAVAALRRQRGVDAARIAVVGASIGASTAAWTISTRPKLHLKTAVGLSPAESPAFIDTGTKGGLHPHDLLLLSDRAEFTNVQGIAQDAGPGVTARRVSVTGHGVTLLTDRAVQELVLSWLRSHLAPRA